MKPRITVRKQWEVACDDCGVIDCPTTKAEAVRVAREHRKWHRYRYSV